MKQEVITAINQERAYQDRKWGADRKYSVGEGLTVLRKVLADAFRAWGVGGPGSDDAALHEIRQVTAVGVGIMETCGVRYREPQDNVNQQDLFDPKSPPDTGVKSEFDIAWPMQRLWAVGAWELAASGDQRSSIIRPDWRSYRRGPTLLGCLEEGLFAMVMVEGVSHTNMAILMTGDSEVLSRYQNYFPELAVESSVTEISFKRMVLGNRK